MRLFVFCLLALAAGACTPVYQTSYAYDVPDDEQGKFCVNQCQLARQSCDMSCQSREQVCQAERAEQAALSYSRYVKERADKGEPIEKEPRDFRRYGSCDNNNCGGRCASTFRSCYMSCGGRVLETKTCTLFCDGVPQVATRDLSQPPEPVGPARNEYGFIIAPPKPETQASAAPSSDAP